MFVGREKELKDLQELFDSDHFEFVVVYGRRRVGKTTLIAESCEGFRTVFHLATKTTEKKTLTDLSDSAAEGLGEGGGLSYRNLDAFLEYVYHKALEENLVLVIDEFPFFVHSIPDAMGSLQRYIDLKFKDTKLKLVLSGSSVSFMEHQVLGNTSPLYGRRTAQFKLYPFPLIDTKRMYGGTEEDTVIIQIITGGIPLYISYFSPKEPLEDTIRKLFFDKNGLLQNEPMNILNMEVSEPQLYFSLLELIAHGANKLSEIADKQGMSTQNVGYYLTTLKEIGIIDKKLPLGEKNKKRTIWYIKDGLFLFYFTHVYPYQALIERGLTAGVYARFQESFSRYIGKPFEELCRDYVLSHAHLMVTSIGSWWGTDPVLKREEEIDVVAKTVDGEMLFGECQFTRKPVTISLYEELRRKSMNIPCEKQRYYWMFSKSGFSPELRERAASDSSLHLVGLEDLFTPVTA